MGYKVAIVGATGNVGREMLNVLAERKFPVGKLRLLFGLLIPHGLIELTSVIIAGAAGLRLGWTVIDPGDRRRADALAEEGRRAIVLVMGTACTLLVAGLIEGFVSPSRIGFTARIAVLVVTLTFWVGYLSLVGLRSRGTREE